MADLQSDQDDADTEAASEAGVAQAPLALPEPRLARGLDFGFALTCLIWLILRVPNTLRPTVNS